MSIFKKIIQRIKSNKYQGLNLLDKQLESYVNYDNGYYVELGANDGINQSNSLYFEKYRGWKGLLIEPSPHNFLKCLSNRSKRNHIECAACVSFDYEAEFVKLVYSNLMSTPIGLNSDIDKPEEHAKSGKQFLKKDEVNFEFGAIAKTLDELLVMANAPQLIDFLSLDVEGAELEVLKGIKHDKFKFKYILVESRNFPRIENYLNQIGYKFTKSLSIHDYLFELI